MSVYFLRVGHVLEAHTKTGPRAGQATWKGTDSEMSKKGYSSVQQGSWGVSLPQSAVSLLQLLVFADLKG